MLLQRSLCDVQRLRSFAKATIQNLSGIGQHEVRSVFWKVLEDANELIGCIGRKFFKFPFRFPSWAIFNFSESIARKKPSKIVPLIGSLSQAL